MLGSSIGHRQTCERIVLAQRSTSNGQYILRFLLILFIHILSCSEYNHVRNSAGKCVLALGATALPNDDSCSNDEDYWYERTEYRKIPKSTCDGGLRLDRGQEHICPGFKAHGSLFWWTIFFVPFGFTALVAFWYYKKGGYRRG